MGVGKEFGMVDEREEGGREGGRETGGEGERERGGGKGKEGVYTLKTSRLIPPMVFLDFFFKSSLRVFIRNVGK